MSFYVGDGIYGFRRWVFARVIHGPRWTPPWSIAKHLDPGLPVGWNWNFRVSGRGLYARHDS